MVDASPQELTKLITNLPVGLAVVDEAGLVLYNGISPEHLGPKVALGQRFPLHLPPGHHQIPSPDLELGPLSIEVRAIQWQGKAGVLYVTSQSESLGWTSEETERMAFQDSLTGLPNFNIIQQFIDFTCTQAQRYERSAALLVIDLDSFKELLSQVGAGAGDELLCQVSTRIQQTVRSSDIVGRRGQDEFMVLLTELTSDRSKERSLPDEEKLTVKERAARVAERILQEFETPAFVAEQPVTLHLSIGLTVCPEDATSAPEMLDHADIALSQAKRLGGDRYVLFDQSLARTRQAQRDQAQLLDESLREGKLRLSYRPWITLADHQPAAQEPLASWLEEPLEDPGQLWSVAEGAGTASQLSEWIIERICSLGAAPTVPIVLPLSVRQLLHSGVAARLTQQLSGSQIPSQKVILLISDSALRLHPTRRLTQLVQLKERGFQLAVQCGPSHALSLGHLSSYRPDWLLVPPLESAGMDLLYPLYREAANAFGCRLVVGGLETPEILKEATRQGVSVGFGQHFPAADKPF